MSKQKRYVLFAGGVIAGILITIPLYINYATKAYIVERMEDAPQATVAIVLGASVIDGAPSPALQERAEIALMLYRVGKVQKILVTGDDSVPGFDEVTPVRRYLDANGVPPKDIFLDHMGFDTYTSMYRAREVFEIQDALIVTQGFHLPRSVFIARNLGLDAWGVVAERRGDPIYNYTREMLASIKAAGDLLFNRASYVGDSYPITGDGQETWE